MELGLINLATLAGQGAQDGPVSCLHLTRVELQMTLFFLCWRWRSNFKLAQQALPTEPSHLPALLFLCSRCQLIHYLSFRLHLS